MELCAPLIGQPALHECMVCCATHNFRFERDFEHFAFSFSLFSYRLLTLGPKTHLLRIFQRFRLVKFIGKFKTRAKNLKIEKIIAFDEYLHELFFAFHFHLSKNLFLTLKNNEIADLTHFSTKCGCF